MELWGTDVTAVAVSAFDYVEVVDVVGHLRSQLDRRRPRASVEQLNLQPRSERLRVSVIVALTG